MDWTKLEGLGLSDVNINGSYWGGNPSLLPTKYKEITLEQFREHVLNK